MSRAFSEYNLWCQNEKQPYHAGTIRRGRGVLMLDGAWTCKLRVHNRSSLDVWEPFNMLKERRMECGQRFERPCEDFDKR